MLAINRADRSFDPEQFLNGARQAYEMIVTAFAEGNRKMLKGLLSREVFEGFARRHHRAGGPRRPDRPELRWHQQGRYRRGRGQEGAAQISVKFVSELISATRDKAGTVLAGDPKKIKEVIDIWTFARDVASRDPNWKLVATQAPN